MKKIALLVLVLCVAFRPIEGPGEYPPGAEVTYPPIEEDEPISEPAPQVEGYPSGAEVTYPPPPEPIVPVFPPGITEWTTPFD